VKDICYFFGLSGLLARSAKIGIDARLIGYEFYYKISYSLYLSSSGDCIDRYILRFNEIIESNKLVYCMLCFEAL